jgi:hypothetical protein
MMSRAGLIAPGVQDKVVIVIDPALVHHYFGTKTQLFAAASHIPIDPRRSSDRCGKCSWN